MYERGMGVGVLRDRVGRSTKAYVGVGYLERGMEVGVLRERGSTKDAG